jgi:hypothetical protein
MAKDESFLTRWSRRKREGERAPAPEDAPPVEADAKPASDVAEAGETQAAPDEMPPEELERLPRIEDITAETDIRQFLKRGVPRALRNAALRRKWLATPAIRDHKDCAVDYAWDWNTPGGVPGDGFVNRESVARLVNAITGRAAPSEGSQAGSNQLETAAPENLMDETGNKAEEAPAAMPESTQQTEMADQPAREPEATGPRQEAPSEDSSPPRRHGRARPV